MAETTVEIVYSAVDAAAVRFETSARPAIAREAELAVFMLFAAHVFADIGTKPWATEFSSRLAALDAQELAASTVIQGVRLDRVADAATARVGFAAWLFHRDDFEPGFFLLGDQRFWRLKIHMPWRERRHGNHYFGTSVAVLLQSLLLARSGDAPQQERLVQAAAMVAALHADGRLRLPSAWTQAVTLAAEDTFGALRGN